MMQIIGFAGRKGSGKDTCADILVQHYGFDKRAFATPLKSFCQQLFLLSDDQLWGNLRDIVDDRYGHTPRQLLQKFGTDFIRDCISPNFWVDRFSTWYKAQSGSVVVSDVRFQNEVATIQQLGGRVYLVERPDIAVFDHHKSEEAESLKGLNGIITNDRDVQALKERVIAATDQRLPV